MAIYRSIKIYRCRREQSCDEIVEADTEESGAAVVTVAEAVAVRGEAATKGRVVGLALGFPSVGAT